MIITLISGKTGLKLILTSFILLVSLSMVSAAESDNQWPQQAYDNQKNRPITLPIFSERRNKVELFIGQ